MACAARYWRNGIYNGSSRHVHLRFPAARESSIWPPGQPAKIISDQPGDEGDDGEDGDCNEDCCSRILGAFRYQNDPNDDKEGTENNSERDCADEIH